MPLKSKKASKGHQVTFACSPLKRSALSQIQHKKSKNSDSQNFPASKHVLHVFPTTFKHAGVRRIVNQYNQIEGEVVTLKQKYYESKLKVKTLKASLEEQGKSSRNAIISCAMKLYEKEKELERFQAQREEELCKLSQDLYLLQSNLMKDQAKLKRIISNKNAKILCQEREIQALKKEATAGFVNDYVDTPESSLDNSPDSSFSIPKFEIKPLAEVKTILASDDKILLPPPPNPPRASRRQLPPVRDQSANDAFMCQKTPNILFGERIKNTNVETVSLGDEGFASSQEENTNNTQPKFFTAFLNENGLDQKSIISPSVTSTNHKEFRKPSDLKKGQKKKTKLNYHELSSLEEHQISSSGPMKKIFYYTQDGL